MLDEGRSVEIGDEVVRPIRPEAGDRGFRYAIFRDRDQADCLLAESSAAGPPAIRLGIRSDAMHLTRAGVAALIPHLLRFLDHGDLSGGSLDKG